MITTSTAVLNEGTRFSTVEKISSHYSSSNVRAGPMTHSEFKNILFAVNASVIYDQTLGHCEVHLTVLRMYSTLLVCLFDSNIDLW